MRTNQVKIVVINLNSNYLEFLELISTVNTKFAIRITVNLVNCMKNS